MHPWNPVKQSGVVVESYKFTDTSEWTRTTIICHHKHNQHLIKGQNESGNKTFSAPCQPGRIYDLAINMSIFHDYSRKRETGWWHSPWMTSWTIERRRCQGLGTTHRQFDIHNWFFCFQWVPSNTKDYGEYIVSYRLKVPKEPSEQCRLIQCTNAYFLVLQVITLNTRVLQRNTVYQKKIL